MKPTETSSAQAQKRGCSEPGCSIRTLHPDSPFVWQLQPGRLDRVADCRVEGRLHLVRVRFSRNVRILIDPGTSFLTIPPDRAGALHQGGAEISRHDVTLSLRNVRRSQHELVVAGGCDVTFAELRDPPGQPNAAPDVLVLRSLAPPLRALIQSLLDQPEGRRGSRSNREWMGRTARLLARAGRDVDPFSALPLAEPHHAVGLIGTLVNDYFATSESPSLDDMCRLTGFSRRALTYAFQKRYGVPPRRFFRNLALNEVRQALINSHGEAKVSAVAPFYGFCHMGQFSADYRAFFDELPSQTLERGRDEARGKGVRLERSPTLPAIHASV